MATLKLTIVSAEKSIFEGTVTSVRATGTEGEFGILPGHISFLTSIKPGIIKFTLEDGREEVIYISGGFLEAQPEFVIVLADVAIRGDELDRERILEAKRRVEEKIAKRGNDKNYDMVFAKLGRELAKLKAYELAEKFRKH